MRYEVRRGLAGAPYLQDVLDAIWLNEPIEISGSPAVLTEINNIRRGLGATPGEETQHLGEAEIIYHLQFVDIGGFFVTDDQPALDFARRRGVAGFDTRRIMEECYAVHEVGCPEAFNLLQQMYLLDRGVRMPASHAEVCPR
ncbi:MAG TPA: hypothetical protein VFB74_27150 [Kribbellaceae bacterium]|nr:hypothetical protein [Kribbellaceae bacterium]